MLHFIACMPGGLLLLGFCDICWNIVLVARKAIFRLVFFEYVSDFTYGWATKVEGDPYFRLWLWGCMCVVGFFVDRNLFFVSCMI
jgi:hypothetical protein